jgi:hypothetical protein
MLPYLTSQNYAGMCDPGPFEPTVYENSKCKEKDHYFVEQYLKEKFVPYTVFRVRSCHPYVRLY